MLRYPDYKREFIVDTDASANGVGGGTLPGGEREERVVVYYSKTLAPPERNYCVTRRELSVLVRAVKHFRP